MIFISLSYDRQTETETERERGRGRQRQRQTERETQADRQRQRHKQREAERDREKQHRTETKTETDRQTEIEIDKAETDTYKQRQTDRHRQTDRQTDRRHHGGPQPFVPHRRLLHLRHYPRPLHRHRHLLLLVWWSTKDNGRVSARGPCYEVHSLGDLTPGLLRFLHTDAGCTCRDVRVRGAVVVEFFRFLCSYNVRLSGHGTASVSSQNNQRL